MAKNLPAEFLRSVVREMQKTETLMADTDERYRKVHLSSDVKLIGKDYLLFFNLINEEIAKCLTEKD